MNFTRFFAAIISTALLAGHASAQSTAQSVHDLSAVPIASAENASFLVFLSSFVPIVVGGEVANLIVESVKVSGAVTAYTMKSVSDGSQATLELAGRGAQNSVLAVGTPVAASVVGTGVVLSVAGVVLAFIPNAIGRALLHNERIGS